MKKLAKYLLKTKKEIILTPLFVIIEVVMEILIPVFMSKLIDDGIKTGNQELVLQNGAIMVVLAIVALISGLLATKFASIAANRFGETLRLEQYKKIQDYSFENIDKFQTSSLVTRMTMDVSMIQQAFQMNIRIAFRAPAMLLFSIISAFIIGGSLALVFVVVVPLLAFGLGLIMTRAHRHFKKMFTKLDRLNLVVQEDLSGIRTIKSFVREDYENQRFKDTNEDVANNSKKAEKWIIFNNPLMQLAIGICFVLISWFGARRMVLDNFTEGQFTNIVTYIMQVLMSLMMLSQVFLFLVISKASVERVNEVLDEEPAIKEIDDPVTSVKDGSFVFQDVSFKYAHSNQKAILNHINLTIPSGSFVGLFGATGTGKSTFVSLLSRLYDATDGNVLVGGINVKSYALDVLRQEVMTVLQKNVLFSGTIRENMQWGLKDATEDQIIEALKKAQAYEFVSKMEKGIDAWVEQGGVNFSGGQRQRLCIARALILKPKILIMDDSTSAVDTKTDLLIRQALKEEAPDMTKIVVSQRLSSIEEADYIVILDNNGINAIGNHLELYSNHPMYQEVYDAQMQGKGSESK